jgi:hypothetical protein
MKSKPLANQNKITSYAEVVSEADLTDQKKIQHISEFHIWSDSYIQARLNWMPQKAIKAVFLKVYKIPEFEIASRPDFQGCKSWIDINAKPDSAQAVLTDSELRLRLKKFEETIS